jgi:hypothetical protein
MKFVLISISLIFLINLGFKINELYQISPGELAKVHSNLEGMSNCTKCHTIGAKISNSKCLACHIEIKERIDKQKGYHASADVKGKECAKCHNDHHGKNFQIIKFNASAFQHSLTGFLLEGAHGKQTCNKCHIAKFISNKKLQAKPHTYLGLNTECVSCHTDYHQNTLTGSCTKCHGQEAFKPALKFSHANSKFQLIGKHQSVACLKCHRMETKAGKPFQKFAGVSFSNCTSCHTDVHQNKFGQNCKQCHSENSFHSIKNSGSFDHSKTRFMLEGKHANVMCASCHKTKFTDPLKFDNCTDCHSDYHKGQFAKSENSPDCIKCHTVNGFSPSNFTIENHSQCNFKLQGAHVATACFECHHKQKDWSFRNVGANCVDCHQNIHKSTISQKYFPNEDCKACHSENSWSELSFDHSKTNFQLTGVHSKIGCKACHFDMKKPVNQQQKFAGLSESCNNCHSDKHNKQFEVNGVTDCNRCHATSTWKASGFNHNNTAFKLDGQHSKLACSKCHKPAENEKVIQYKIKKFKCEDCHTQ